MWKNGTAFPLQDLGVERSNFAFAINNLGQIVGQVRTADGSTRVASLWQPDGTLTVLGILPGEMCRHRHRHQQQGPSGGKHL